jgi:iron complex outermembrane receptor protein
LFSASDSLEIFKLKKIRKMKKIALLLFALFPQILFAQYQISGTIRDASGGEPIAGVRIENNGKRVVSQSDGTFTIEGKPGVNNISFNHVAYQTQTKKVKLGSESSKGELEIFMELKISEFEETVISATRSSSLYRNIPYSVSVLDRKQIELSSYNNVDDVLQQIAGMKAFRPMGIFQHSPSASLIGSGNVPGRTLIVVDGIPLNKADNGNVNLNRISPVLIERIEVLHNGSAGIYGSNAMNGVVNIITKQADTPGLRGTASIEAASFSTFGGNLLFLGKSKNEKFSFRINGNYRQSDGRISTPDSLQEESIEYIPSWLKEYYTDLSGSYRLSENHSIRIIYSYFDDARSTGEKIREEKGTYNEHDTHSAGLNYSGKYRKTAWNADFYLLQENYFRNMENIRQGNYSLIHVNSLRQDWGSSLNITQEYLSQSSLIAGVDFRQGKVHGTDDYISTGDQVNNRGTLSEIDFYLQNRNSVRERLHIIQGLRYSQSRIYDAAFTIEKPSSETAFMTDYTGEFGSDKKEKFIASLAIKYNISSKLDFSAGYNPGFRSPTLDDMTRSGLMHLGFKLANPELKPELSDNFYASADIKLSDTQISLTGAYNFGHNYMYYIGTGDSIFGGRRPVVQLKNITEVNTKSLVLDVKQKIGQSLNLYANYSYSDARIQSYREMPELEGKQLTYNSLHTVNAGLNGRTNLLDFGLDLHYRSEQFTNDENTESLPAFTTVDVLVRKTFFEKFALELSAQNVLDKSYLVYYSQLSMGRFLSAKLIYTLQ